ncbi:MAG: Ig-like domain-containing protein, partial [Phycisphaerae bacterium]|nr:Ig-like domain-containing protein [Gemmatimonadaceae bacterium]
MRSSRHNVRQVGVGILMFTAIACTDEVVQAPTAAAPKNAAAFNIATTIGAVVPVASVTLTPATLTLLVGTSKMMASRVVDLQNVVRPDLTISWVTENPAVATVTSDGLVYGK